MSATGSPERLSPRFAPGFLIFDFETDAFVDLKVAGAWRYAEDFNTSIICMSFSVNGEEPLTHIDFIRPPVFWKSYIEQGYIFIAHNAQFERAIYQRILVEQYDWPAIPLHLWHCTLAAAAKKSLPQSLEDLSRALKLGIEKDKEGSLLTRSMSKFNKKGNLPERTPERIKRIVEYCENDIAEEVEIHQYLGWLPDNERDLWIIYEEINERGLCLDREFITAAQKVVNEAAVPLLKEFQEITGIAKLMSPKFKGWLHSQGVHLDDLRAETIDDMLEDEDDEDPFASDLPAHAARALRIKRLIGSSSVKKLKRMDAVICADGRARGLLQWHGTAPGRSAGRLFQPQNFPRGTIEVGGKAPDPEFAVNVIKSGDWRRVERELGPATESVLSSLRHAIIAAPGHRLMAGDYAGIQARVVLALAGQHDKAQMMANGLDVYCDMAENIFHHPVTKKANPHERHIGKNAVLGSGFGLGGQGFQTKFAKKETLEFCEEVIRTYRKVWAPRVPQLWRALENAAVRCVHERRAYETHGIEYRLEDGWLTARVPSGHKIYYYNPQPCMRAMPWDPDDIRPSFTYMAQKQGQWSKEDTFGGKLTENVVMRIEVDIKNKGMRNLRAAGFPIILDVHDELVCEVLEARVDKKAFLQCLLDQDQWVRDMQIPVAVPEDEAWIGGRYKK